MIKISNIAQVTFGTYATGSADGSISLIQAGSITEYGDYSPENNLMLYPDKIDPDDLLHEGCILFAAKGSRKKPYVVKKTDLPAAASSVFFVIKPDPAKVNPEFLAWLLGTRKINHLLAILSEGSTISSISIKEFREIELNIPELSVQNKIEDFQHLQKRYNELTAELLMQINALNKGIANKLT